jgi:HlyD family secretion protein
MKRKTFLAIAILAIALGAFFGYRQWSGRNDSVALATAPVTRGDIVETVDATGTLQAVTTVQVGTQISGTVKALYADFNSEVHKGQVIAELDPSLLQTEVEQARATIVRLQAEVDRARVQLDDAKIKAQRAQELFDRQLISRNDLETAQSTMMTAEAAVKSAQAQVVQARASLNQNTVNLGHAVIRAPIDGIVISRNVDVGQTVAASMQAPTLFVIARDLSQMQLSASVDESDVGRVQPGQQAAFRVDAYGNETFSGVVSQVRLQPVVEQNVVSYVTIIDVPNPDLRLKPGMTATLTLEVARANGTLRVPNAAMRFRPTAEVFAALHQQPPEPAGRASEPEVVATTGTTGSEERPVDRSNRAVVWVLEDGQLHPVRVDAGISDGVMTAVAARDLAEGAQVVTGVTAPGAAASSAPATGSPLIPFGNRRRGAGQASGSGGARSGSAGRR